MMTRQWLNLLGGVCLLAGIWSGLWSSRVDANIMGGARLGYGLYAPDEGSPDDLAKRADRAKADRLFYSGIALTGVGVVMQTAAGMF